MWMNQAEIEWAAAQKHRCPNVTKGVKLLLHLMQATNEQSDGWAYWRAPSKSAEKLQKLLATAGNLQRGTHGTITQKELVSAIAPIKAMITRQKKLQAKYGNSFDFDVDTTLASCV